MYSLPSTSVMMAFLALEAKTGAVLGTPRGTTSALNLLSSAFVMAPPPRFHPRRHGPRSLPECVDRHPGRHPGPGRWTTRRPADIDARPSGRRPFDRADVRPSERTMSYAQRPYLIHALHEAF